MKKEKLVRHKLKDNPRNDQIFREPLIQENLIPFFQDKLIEECREFIDNPSVEEAADILEVLRAYLFHCGKWSGKGNILNDIENFRRQKEFVKGNFMGCLLMEIDNNRPKLAKNLPMPESLSKEQIDLLYKEDQKFAIEFKKKIKEMENLTAEDWSAKIK